MLANFPKKTLVSHIAVLGKAGSGKTYAVRGIVEELLDDNARVCIVDPTGAWNGLRSSVSGKRGGYPVVIFGGTFADLPVGGTYGEAIAEVIGTSSTPAIIDTSLMRIGERTRFFADFGDTLLRKNKGPLHLIIDEAHLFAPQGKVNDPQSGAMLHAANNLVSLGRVRGLRVIMITQRPAKLHKDSLTQCETLVAMRLIAPQDRKAVREWIEDNADEDKAKEIISSLATLKTGYGWVWAPEIDILDQIHFPKIKTFDSSRAPDGTEVTGKVYAPIDKDAIAQKLQTVAADVVANDPAALKKELAAVKRELAMLKAAPAVATKPDLKELEREYRIGYDAALTWMQEMLRTNGGGNKKPWAISTKHEPKVMKSGSLFKLDVRKKLPVAVDGAKLAKGEAEVLSACIQHIQGLRREQLTVLTGYKRSTRDAYIYRLKEKGFVEISGDLVTATEAGRAALPDAKPLPTGAALQEHWLGKLPQGERTILEVLLKAYPNAVMRDALTEATGFKRSTRDAYIYRMTSKHLVVEPTRGEVLASETLFG